MEIDKAKKREILQDIEDHTVDLSQKISRVKGVIYGPWGSGKTTWAMSVLRAILGPDKTIIFVDHNDGWESLRNHKSLVPNVKVIPYRSLEQLQVIAEAVYRKAGWYANVGGIILDDADFMADDHLISLWHNRRGDSKSDPDKPDRPEYLKLGFAFMEILETVFQHTPDIHLILTAHDGKSKSKDGQVVTGIYPGFNPALAEKIAGRVQLVGYMAARNVKRADNKPEYTRTIQVHPTGIISAKSRIGCEKVIYTDKELRQHLVKWALEGRPEDPEKDAILKEIETSRTTTNNDLIAAGEEDDDTPVLVE